MSEWSGNSEYHEIMMGSIASEDFLEDPEIRFTVCYFVKFEPPFLASLRIFLFFDFFLALFLG